MPTLIKTDIYAILGEEFSQGRSNIEVTRELIKAGVQIIQYREKEKKAGEKYRECLAIRELTKKAGVQFIVNDDVDIAVLVGADGVHIGQEDLPIEAVRELVGPQMVIGVSTHSPEQGRDAVDRGADYIGVGPIFPTKTKKDVCSPVGLEYLDWVVANLDIPFVAIGGIKEHNIEQVAQRGARCICLVTEILGASDIPAMVQGLRQRIQG
ncbi:MAG: thiamine phosphate synthase [Limnochordia bacterium]